MKLKEIKLSGTYTNGKQKGDRYYSVRIIVEEGSHLAYKYCKDTDFVKYKIIDGRGTGQEGRMTRQAFASWARTRLEV